MSLRSLAAQLRRKLPTLHPVRVRRRSLKRDLGSCELVRSPGSEPYFSIVVCSGIDHELAEHVLMHEWAHARVFVDGADMNNHGPGWGVAYAEVWSAVRGD